MTVPVLEVPDWVKMALEAGRHESPATDATTKEILKAMLELEWRRCEADAFYFLRTYVKILLHNSAEVVPFPITDEQEDFLRAFFEEDRLITLKARQIGFSTAVGAGSFWEIYFHPNWETLFLSSKEDDAVVLLQKAKLVYEQLPQWMKDRGPKRTTNNMTELRFDHNSVIESLQSKNNPARSRSARRLVGDEFSFFDDQEGATASFGPTIDNGAKLVLLSTANGIGDEFYRLVTGARAGEKNGGWPLSPEARSGVVANTYAFRFYSWRARRGRDDAWYEKQRLNMLPHLLAREFPSDPDEAFRQSGNLYFDHEILSEWVTEPGTAGFLHENEFHESRDGDLEIWAYPAKGAKYALAMDPAGVADGDASILTVIRAATGEHVATMELHLDGDKAAGKAYALGKFYNWAMLGVEANGVGLAVLFELKRLKYPRLYYRWIYDRKTKQQTPKLGWLTQYNKEAMMSAMWRVLRDGLVKTKDAAFVKEMGEFRRYTDREGKVIRLGGQPHDDRVMSFAIAMQLLQHLGNEAVERASEEEPPILEPGVVDYGPKEQFSAWARLAKKEKQWAKTTTPRRVPMRGATLVSGVSSDPSVRSTAPRRLTRTGK